jgi:hypothetical protein
MRHLKRIHPFVWMMTFAALLTAATLVYSQSGAGSTEAEGPPADPGAAADAVTARRIREALGFGPMDVLPAMVGRQAHQRMIEEGLTYLAAHEAEVTPLAEAYWAAKKELLHRIAWSNDPPTGFAELQQARQAIVDACQPLLSSLRAELAPAEQGIADRYFTNEGLDPDLRLLELSDEQREGIRNAQFERDLVTKDARNWHKPSRLETARTAFESTLQTILTEEQQQEA